MKVLAIVALCLSVIVLSSAQNCDNPMHDSVESGSFRGAFLDDPAVYTGTSGVCRGARFDGQPQCCADATYDFLSAQWLIVRTEMQESVDALEEARREFDTQRGEYDKLLDQIEDDDTLSDEQKDAIRRFVDKLFDALEKFIDGVIETYVPCGEAILRVLVRYACLMCDANWEDFITRPGALWWRITWANEVCDDLSDNCGAFFDLFVELGESFEEAFNELSNSGAFGDSSGDDDFEFGDICDGVPCSDYICRYMIANPNYDPNFEDDVDNKRMIAEKAMVTKARTVLGKHADVIKPVEHAMKMKNALHMLRRQTSPDTDGDFKESLFASNGFNYDTSKSDLDTSVSPSASLSSWLF